MLPISVAEFKQISQWLHDQCGLFLRDNQEYLVQTRLGRFTENLGLSSFSELNTLLRYAPEKYLSQVISLMTTNETLWFRDESCWNALEKDILPRLIQIQQRTNKIMRVWVAGCSTGQEAYSLAILLDELCQKDIAKQFQIYAMDISQAALETAKAGRYNALEMKRGLSPCRRDKYFEPDHQYWILRSDIRLRVQFDTINLTHDFSRLGQFDLILCRNVTIYFTPETRQRILLAMTKMLSEQGALLLGATESVCGLTEINSSEFEGCIYLNAKIAVY